MRRVADSLEELAATLWVGGLWAVGYLAVPVLFASLSENKPLAGVLAGKLFVVMAWVGLACAAYLLLVMAWRLQDRLLRRAGLWIILAMAGATMAQLWWIQPMMAGLKEAVAPVDVMESGLRERFVFWHGISSVLYLVQSMLGFSFLIWRRGAR
ncbi:MAG: DUF4149 domain-containing protein [Rhodocyclales bacterium]|nr:DUF4149 domain-containing protein [Rhodocyclales bacterium]